MIKEYTYNVLDFVRACLGLYLVSHFAYLIPYASELFSADGMFPANLSLTYPYFPNLFNISVLDNSLVATSLCVILSILSLLITFGSERRLVYLLTWFGWATLLCRNPLIRNPGMPYIGWMLLAFITLFPIREKTSFKMPKILYYGAWALLAIGYTLSGLDKLNAVSWQDGSAITHLLNNPLARVNFITKSVLEMPWLHTVMSYLSLAMELFFLSLALFRRTRPWIWLGLIFMQFGILFQVDFADLTFGMLIIHLFVFDPRWITQKSLKEPIIVFFDGVCGLCNRSVDFIMMEDWNGSFRFSPLQGEEATKHFSSEQIETLDTIYVLHKGHLYKRSEAIVIILNHLGGLWYVLGFTRFIPTGIRDIPYKIISKYRYVLFGKKESCRIPSAKELELFIK